MSTIVKPKRDEDLYVVWSDIVDAPLHLGDRNETYSYLLRSAEPPGDGPTARLDRAGKTGSSAIWPSADKPHLGYGDNTVYDQQGLVKCEDMGTLAQRVLKDDGADVSDLLSPFDDDR